MGSSGTKSSKQQAENYFAFNTLTVDERSRATVKLSNSSKFDSIEMYLWFKYVQLTGENITHPYQYNLTNNSFIIESFTLNGKQIKNVTIATPCYMTLYNKEKFCYDVKKVEKMDYAVSVYNENIFMYQSQFPYTLRNKTSPVDSNEFLIVFNSEGQEYQYKLRITDSELKQNNLYKFNYTLENLTLKTNNVTPKVTNPSVCC